MKLKIYSLPIIFLLLLAGPKIMAQNMDICASVSGNILTFTYQPQADFTAPPFNFWNSQLITIRYPNTVTVTWGGIISTSNYSWQADSATPGIGVDGGDGFIYKTFISANTPMQNFNNGVDFDVFNVSITPSANVTFELITNNAWTNANAKNAAVNNAITANEFNAFSTTCGSQTYIACDASTTTIAGSTICLGDDEVITVTGGSLDDGTYTFTYDLGAPNAATGLTGSVTLAGGTGTLTVDAGDLTTAAAAQSITITQIEDVMGCLLTGLSITDDFVINALPDVSTLTIVADDICVGDDGNVTITTSLIDGTYDLTYDLAAPNAATGLTASVTVASGSATMTIPAASLSNTSASQSVTVTNVTDGNSCAPASALSVSDAFAINALPDVSTLTIVADDICVGDDGNVTITTSLADGTYDLTYDLAAPNAATGLTASVTVASGSATMTIPAASLSNTTASQSVTVTNVTDGNSCAPASALSVSDAFAINALPDVSTLTIVADDICVGDDGNVTITTSLADGTYDLTYDLAAPNAATGLTASVTVASGSATMTIPAASLSNTTASQSVTVTNVTDGNSCAPASALSVSDAFAINALPDVSTLTIVADDICVGDDGNVTITTSLVDGTYDFTYDLSAPNAATDLTASVTVSGGSGTMTIPAADLTNTGAAQTVTITTVTDGNSCAPASPLSVSDAFAINGLPDVSTLTIVADDICVGDDGNVTVTTSLADGTYDFTYDLSAPNAATGLTASVSVSGGSATMTIPSADLTNTGAAQTVTITTVTDGNSCAPASPLSVSDAFAINGLPDVTTLTIVADDICVGDDGNVTITTSLADGTYDFTYDLSAPNAATGLTASVTVSGGSATMTIPAADLTNTGAAQTVTITTVTDGNSCAPASPLSVSDAFAINGLPDVTTLTIVADDICVGDDGNVTITTSLADGTYDFTYDLSAPNAATDLTASVTVSGGSGTMTIPAADLTNTGASQTVTITTVTDGNSCAPASPLSVSDAFAINGLPDVSTLTIVADDICVGDDGNVTVTTSLADGTYDFTYDLSAPNAASDLTASVTVSGGSGTMTIPAADLTNTGASQTVTITTVTDGNSCAPASPLSVSDAFAINGLPDVTTLTIVADDICVGDDGNVTVTTSLADGTYDFTYDLSAPNAASDLTASVTVSGGSGTMTIPAADLTNTGAAQTVTITTVTDGNSCAPASPLSVSDAFAINGLPDVTTLTIVADDICVGDDGNVTVTTSLADGTYDFTYDLSAPNAATDLTASVTVSGGSGTMTIPAADLTNTGAAQTVTITTVTDGNSCAPASPLSVSDAFAINGLPDVTTLTIVADDICVGDDGNVTITTSLADGTYDFTYDLSAPNAATGLTASVTVSGGSATMTIPAADLTNTGAAQTVTITTVTDGNSCAPASPLSVSDAFAINGLPDVSTLTIVADDICVGDDGNVTVTTSLADGTYDFTYDLSAPNAASDLTASVTVSGGSAMMTIPAASLSNTTASQTVTVTNVTDGNSCSPASALSVSDAFAINALPDVSTLTIVADDICVGDDGNVTITTSLADGTYDFTYDLAAPNAATGLTASVTVASGSATMTIPAASLSNTTASQSVTVTNVTDGNSCAPASALSVSDAFAINALPDVSTLTIVADDICVGDDGNVTITTSLIDGTYDFTYDLAAPNAATGLTASVTVSSGSATMTIPAASLSNTTASQSVTVTNVTDGNSCSPASALSVSDDFAINALPDVSTLTIVADDICVGDDGNVTITTSLADGTYDLTYDLAAPNAATGLTASVTVSSGSATMTIPAASLSNTTASQTVTVTNVTDGNSCSPASALSVSDAFAINALPDVSTLTIVADDICVGDDGNVTITTSLVDGTYDFTYDLAAPNAATGLTASVTVSSGSATMTIPAASLSNTTASQSVTVTNVTDGNSCAPASALSVSDDFAINALPDVSTLTIVADDICVGDDGNVTITTSLADGTYDFTYDLAAPNAATGLTASVTVSSGSATMTIPAASLSNTTASQTVTVTNVTDGNSCSPASALSVSDAFAINALPDVSTLTIVADDICVGDDGNVTITTSLADGTYDLTYDLAAPNAATGLTASVTVSGGSATMTIPAASLSNTTASQSVTVTNVTDGNSCAPASALSVSDAFAINALPDVSTLTIVADDICVGDDGNVTITTSLADGTYDFTYDLAAPNAASGLTASVTVSSGSATMTIPAASLSNTSASQSVTVTNVTDGNSCAPASALSVSDAFAINALPDVSTLTIVADDICVGDDGNVTITTSLIDGTYDFTYDLAAPNAATGLTASVTVAGGSATMTIPAASLSNTTASQTVTVTNVTDGNSCAPASALSVSDAFAINALPDVSTLTIVADDICVGDDGNVTITTSLADGTYDLTYDLAAPNAATGLTASVTVSGGSATMTIPAASLSNTTASQSVTVTNVTDGNSCAPASALSVSDAFAINALPDVSTLTIVADDICVGDDGNVTITTSLADGTYDFTYDLAAPNAASGLTASVTVSSGSATMTIPAASLSNTTASQSVTVTNVTDGNSCAPASALSVSDAFAINALPDVSTLTIVADDICVGDDGNVTITTSLADGTYDLTYDLAAPNAATGLTASVTVASGSATMTIPAASLSNTTASQSVTVTNVTDGNSCAPASALSVSDAFAINALPDVSTLTIVADDICVGDDGNVTITTSLIDGTYDFTYDLAAPNAATGLTASVTVSSGSATMTIPAASLSNTTASQSVTVTNVTDGNSCAPASALSVSDAFAINALPDVSTLTIVADDICVGDDGNVTITTSLADGTYDLTYDLAAPNAATGLTASVTVSGGSATMTIPAASLSNTTASQSVTVTNVTDGNSCAPASALSVSDAFAINALPDVSTLTIVADDICVGDDGNVTITTSLADGTYDFTYDLAAPNAATDLTASVTVASGSATMTIPAASLSNTTASQSVTVTNVTDGNSCAPASALSVSDAFAINALPDVSTLTIVADDICVGDDGNVTITTSLADGTYDLTYDLAAPNAATGLTASVTVASGSATMTIPAASLSNTTASQSVTVTNVTDGNSCAPASALSVSDAFAINALPDVSTLTIVADDICVGDDGNVTITTSLIDGTYDFTYDLAAPNAATGLTASVTVSSGSATMTIPAASLSNTTASQSVTVTNVTDGNSCAPASALSVSDAFAINALPDVSTLTIVADDICVGDDGNVTITTSLIDGTYDFTYDLAAPNAATGLTASVTVSGGSATMTIPAASLSNTTASQSVTVTNVTDGNSCAPASALSVSDAFAINALPDVSTLTIVADDICVGDDGNVTITTSLIDGTYDFTYDLAAPNAATGLTASVTVSSGSATMTIPAASLSNTTASQTVTVTNVTDGNSCSPASALSVSDAFAINALPDVSTLTIVADDICVGDDGNVTITTSLADGTYDLTYDLAAPNAATGLTASVTVSGGSATMTIPAASLSNTTASQSVTVTNVTDGNSCAPASALSVSDAFAINELPDVSTLTIAAEDICVGENGNVTITTSLADGTYDLTYDLAAPNAASGLTASVTVSSGSATMTIPAASLSNTTASQSVTVTNVTDGNSCAPASALSVSDAFAINALPDVSTLTIVADDICVGDDGNVTITTSLADGTYDLTYDLAAPNAATGLTASVTVSSGSATMTIPAASLSNTTASQSVTVTNVTDGNSCAPASALSVSDAFAINALPDVSTLTIVADDICVGDDGNVTITTSLADGTYDFTYDLGAPNNANDLTASVAIAGGTGTLTIPAANLTTASPSQSIILMNVVDGNSCAVSMALSVSDVFAINALPDISTLNIDAMDICLGDDGSATITTSLANGTYDFTYNLGAPNAATGLTGSVTINSGSGTLTIPAANLSATAASQTLTVTNVVDGNSCAPASALSASDAFTINTLPDVSTLTIVADDICLGDDGNVTITTSLDDGTYDFTYDLAAPNAATGLTASVTVISGSGTLTIPAASLTSTSASQTVTVTNVTDGNSCAPASALSVSDAFTINGLPDVSTLAISVDDICVGNDATATITTSLGDGSYDFTYDLAAPNAATGLTGTVIISGGTGTLTIPAANLTNTTASQTITISDVTDGNNCAPSVTVNASDAFAINALPDVSTLTISVDDICVGEDATVSITTSLVDGTYDFTYDLAAPNAATGLTASVTVSSGSGTMTIPAASLSNTAASQSVTVTNVTDGNGCEPASAVSVSDAFAINALPDVSTLTILADDICVGADGNVTVTTSLVDGTYDFVYDLGAPNNANDLTGSVTVSGGTGVLTIPAANLTSTSASQSIILMSITDANGCSPSGSVSASDVFAVNALPDVSTLNIAAADICVGADGSVEITTSLANGTYDFTYNLAAPNAATDLTASVTISGGSGTMTIPAASLSNTTASQTVTVTNVTDGNNCSPASALSTSDAFAINALPDVSTLTINVDDICVGEDGTVLVTTSLADGTYDFSYDLGAPNAATGLTASVTVSSGSGTMTIPAASLANTTASQTVTVTNVTDGNSCSPASALSVSDAFAINGLPDVSTLTIVADDICVGVDGNVTITTSLTDGSYDFTYDLAAPNAGSGLTASVTVSGGSATMTIPAASLTNTTATQTVTITNVTDGNSCAPASALSVSDAFAINELPDVSTLTIAAEDICVGENGNVTITTSLADGTYDFTYDLAAPNAATGLSGSVTVSGGSGVLMIPAADLTNTAASQSVTITNVTDGNGCEPTSAVSVSDVFAINALPDVSTLTIVADDICVGADGNVTITTSLADDTYDFTYDLGAPNAATGLTASVSVSGGSATLTIPAANLTNTTASQSVTITNVTDGNGCSPASAVSVSDVFAINALPNVSTLTIVADDICEGVDGNVTITTSLADGMYDFTYDLGAPNAATGLTASVAISSGSGTLTIPTANLSTTTASQSITITDVTDGNNCFPAAAVSVSDDFAINALPDASTLTMVADDICVGADGNVTFTTSLGDGTYDFVYDLGAPNNANDLTGSVTVSSGTGVLTIPAANLTSTSASQSIILMSITDANGCSPSGSVSTSDVFAVNALPDVSTLNIAAADICVGADGSVEITSSLASGTYDFTYDLGAPNVATGLTGSVSISGGAGTLTIPAASLSNTAAGQVVTITNVTDGNGCSPASALSTSDAFAINALPDVSTLTISVDDICLGEDGVAVVTTSLIDGTYDFTYDLAAPNAATGLTASVTVSSGSGTMTIPAASLSNTAASQSVTITNVTDGNSCSPASALSVSDAFAINALPDVSTLTIVADDICVGADGNVTITTSLADDTYDFTYDLGAPNAATGLTASVSVSGGSATMTIPAANLTNTTASQSVTITNVTDGNGCSPATVVSVSDVFAINALPDVSTLTIVADDICEGVDGNVTISTSLADGMYDFTYDLGAPNAATGLTASVAISSGSGTLTIPTANLSTTTASQSITITDVTDGNNCFPAAAVSVSDDFAINALPDASTLTMVADDICVGADGNVTFTTSLADGTYDFVYDLGAPNNANDLTGSVSVSSGTGVLTIPAANLTSTSASQSIILMSITDANGCSPSGSVSTSDVFAVNALPDVSTLNIDATDICVGADGSVAITSSLADGTYDFTYDLGAPNAASGLTASVTTSGGSGTLTIPAANLSTTAALQTITITNVTDGNGCSPASALSVSDAFAINELPDASDLSIVVSEVCIGDDGVMMITSSTLADGDYTFTYDLASPNAATGLTASVTMSSGMGTIMIPTANLTTATAAQTVTITGIADVNGCSPATPVSATDDFVINDLPDCTCALTILNVGTPGACNGDGTYNVDVTVTYTAPGTSGFVVNGQVFAYTGRPQTVTLTLPGDGSLTRIHAWDLDSPECEDTVDDAYTAPDCSGDMTCAMSITDLGTPGACNGDGTYDIDVTVTYLEAGASGFVLNGQVFAYTSSPQTVTISLPGDGGVTTLQAWDVDNPTCSDDFADAYTAPDCSGDMSCAMSITGVGTPGACNGDGTYDIDVTVTYLETGANGFVLNGEVFAYTTSPQTVTISLPGDGGVTTLQAWDVDSPDCSDDFADAYTAPDCSGDMSCAMAITGVGTPGACNGDGTYDIDVTLTYTQAGANGFVLNGEVFAYTTSPQTVTISLPGDGGVTTLQAWDVDSPDCNDDFADAYTAPDCSGDMSCAMSITGVGTPGACNGDGTYDIDVTLTYTNAGANGFVLNGQVFAYTSSPQTVTISLPGDGGVTTLQAWDVDSPDCDDDFADAYTAPDCSGDMSCAMSITGVGTPGACNGDGTYDIDVTLTYTNAGANGFVLKGQVFAYTTSPQTVTITLPGDGTLTTLKAWDVDSPDCNDDFGDAYTAPDCSGDVTCAIAIVDIDLDNVSDCIPATSTFTVPVTIAFVNPGGPTFTINGNTFAYTVSPQTVMLSLPADGNVVTLTVTDDTDGGCTASWANAFTAPAACEPPALVISAKVFLQASYDPATGMMRDDLRALDYLPETEPYTGNPNYTHVGGGGEMVAPSVFDVTGNDAIVDWVFLELRDGSDSTVVVATRSALVQRDGDIVDIDGASTVSFEDVPVGDYYLVARHRNHLGVMTMDALSLSDIATAVDFTNAFTPTFGMHAQKIIEPGVTALWAGNADGNDQIVFVGAGTDNITLSTTVLLDPANAGIYSTSHTVDGYYDGDVNMDGTVIYVGAGTDQILISSNVLLHPENTSFSQSAPIFEQIP